MSNTITVRLTDEQREWLSKTSRKTGVPVSKIVRDFIEKGRKEEHPRPWMKFAGSIRGLPPDLSSRKGFSR